MTMRVRVHVLVLGALILAASCGGDPKPKGGGKPVVTGKTKKPKKTAKLGQACVSKTVFDRGNCGEGMFCSGQAGGACASACPCKAGSMCVETSKFGELCVPSCKSDADCRGAEGYVCDPARQVCVEPGFVPPAAPECAGLPVPRKVFGKPQQITSSEGLGAYTVQPAARLNGAGDLTVVYAAGMEGGKPNALGALAIGGKGGVFDLGELRGKQPNQGEPRLVVDRTGRLVLVWLGYNAGREPWNKLGMSLAVSPDGKQWGKPVPAIDLSTECPDDQAGCIANPVVALGPDKLEPLKDALYIGYWNRAAGGLRVAKSLDGGASFAAPVGAGVGMDGDLQITASGGLHLAYVAAPAKANPFGDAATSVEYVKSTDGGATFTQPVQVSGTGEEVPLHFGRPKVIPDLDRRLLYVVYVAGPPTGAWNLMLATSKDGGETWSRIKINDDMNCANHMLPAVALEPASGRLHIIWTENRGNVGGVSYARCDKGGAKCGKNEGVSDLPFAAYSLVRFSPRWLGDQNALVFDEKNEILHAVWAQTVEEGGQPHARLFHATAKTK